MTNNENPHDPEKDNNLEPATERETLDPAPAPEEPVVVNEDPNLISEEPSVAPEEPVVADNVPTETEPAQEEVPGNTSPESHEDSKKSDTYDPATTPVSKQDSKRSVGSTIAIIIVAAAALFAGVFGIFLNASAANETRNAIERVNLDTYGLTVVKDSIRGNQFLATGSDPNSDMNYYVQCKLDKYTIDGEKKGIVFCESTFVTEVNIGGEN